ncbi:MAG: DUF2608 domain-containing protein [Parachlamydiales bacterium]|jgi:hypothetical protein
MILEIATLKALENAIPQQALIVLDIDNTLIEADSYLGSEAWESYYRNKLLQEGLDFPTAALYSEELWHTLQNHIAVRALEKEGPSILSRWQQKHTVVGLTKRRYSIKKATLSQLRQTGYRLQETKGFPVDKQASAGTAGGIIFCGHLSKSEALQRFITPSAKNYPAIIAVDDRQDNLDDLAGVFGSRLTGFRITICDNQAACFDGPAAEAQLQALKNRLSKINSLQKHLKNKLF